MSSMPDRGVTVVSFSSSERTLRRVRRRRAQPRRQHPRTSVGRRSRHAARQRRRLQAADLLAGAMPALRLGDHPRGRSLHADSRWSQPPPRIGSIDAVTIQRRNSPPSRKLHPASAPQHGHGSSADAIRQPGSSGVAVASAHRCLGVDARSGDGFAVCRRVTGHTSPGALPGALSERECSPGRQSDEPGTGTEPRRQAEDTSHVGRKPGWGSGLCP